MAVAAHDWDLWSTRARIVVTRPDRLADALDLAHPLLDEVELAASRFRPDSEVRRLAARPTSARTPVSPMLTRLLRAALAAAEATDGAVDPTVGAALAALGYDRDIAEIAPDDRAVVVRRVPGWRRIRLDDRGLSMPPGVELDLGATAKAVAADLVARRVAEHLDTGVLVNLGGDIATAGPAPAGGWQVTVQDGEGQPAAHVTLPAGSALATSSTRRRTWRRAGRTVHHIVDPGTGRAAAPVWRTVSVAAASCVDANTASTAAIVKGRAGRTWLRLRGHTARLVDGAGLVHLVGGWPDEHDHAA